MNFVTIKYTPSTDFVREIGHQHLHPVQGLRIQMDAKDGLRVLCVMNATRLDRDRGHILAMDEKRWLFTNMIEWLAKNGHDIPDVKEFLVLPERVCDQRRLGTSYQQRLRSRALIARENRRFLRHVLDRWQPDRVLLFGAELTDYWMKPIIAGYTDVKARQLFCSTPGRVYKLDFGTKHQYPTAGVLSLSTLNRSSGKDGTTYPPLIGFALRAMAAGIRGKSSYTVDTRDMRVNMVDTRDKLETFFDKLWQQDEVAIDTEGTSLSRVDVHVLTMQFAWREDEAWVVPVEHPGSPWKPKTIDYIRDEMYKYLTHSRRRTHVMTNAKWDVLVLRRFANAPYYSHKLWDIQAGEWALDENRRFLNNIGIEEPYSLDQIMLDYGNLSYHDPTAKVTKKDRAFLIRHRLQDVAYYGSLDVVGPKQIARFQRTEAKRRGKHYDGYQLMVREQIGEMLHTFAEMEMNGISMDPDYLEKLVVGRDSIFNKAIGHIYKEIYKFPAVQEAEQRVTTNSGLPETTLFGNRSDDNANRTLNLSKKEHAQTLFIDVLRLKPLEFAVNGDAKLNKAFKKHYGKYTEEIIGDDVVPKPQNEVAYLQELDKIRALRQNFGNPLYKRITTDPDCRDLNVRARHVYTRILTGRAAETDPSFHNVPMHGYLAKHIRRAIVAAKQKIGCLLVKADYSAHEVKNWALIANDQALADRFRVGLKEWQRYRTLQVVDKVAREEWKKIKVAIDIHRQNYAHFNPGVKPGDVTKEQRQGIKEIVFGVIYQKSARALAKQQGISEQKAQGMIDDLFYNFPDGGDWIEQTRQDVNKLHMAFNPFGGIRHLWAAMHPDDGLRRAMERRGINSPIQGIASMEMYTGCRQMQNLVWQFFVRRGQRFSWEHMNVVHDANENRTGIVDMPIGMYLLEHAQTTMVHRRCREVFGFKLNVNLEMEMDIGPHLADLREWDYTVENMMDITEHSMRWLRDNLGHRYEDERRMLRDVEHNATILRKLRRKELLQTDFDRRQASEIMLMNPDNALDMGLRFSLPYSKY